MHTGQVQFRDHNLAMKKKQRDKLTSLTHRKTIDEDEMFTSRVLISTDEQLFVSALKELLRDVMIKDDQLSPLVFVYSIRN